MDIDDIDFSATMEASYDASEQGTEYVPPTNDVEKEPATEAGNEAALEADNEGVDQDSEQELEQAMPSTLEPPARWSSDDKAAFSALPPEAQQLVLKREKDVESYLTQKSQELSQTSSKYKGLDEVLESRRQALVMNYGSEANAINALFSYSDMADQDPVRFINMLAQSKGIDLASLAQPSDEYSDPEISALKQEVAQLRQQSQQAMTLQTQQQQQEVVNQVNAFETAKDEAGKPAHPHFAAVRNHMSALLTAGTAQSLQDAYEQAVWANPETRKSVMGNDEASRIAKAKAKAAAAEKAASVRPRSSNGQFVNAPGKTIDDTMSTVFDSMHGA